MASDPDREGEAIAWHLVAALGLTSRGAVRRISFQEITRGAILQAVQQPRAIDVRLVDAQQARRILDRLIGYHAAPGTPAARATPDTGDRRETRMTSSGRRRR